MNIPEGYKLVPVLPTDKMKKAYQDGSLAPISCLSRYGYEAMIKEAPVVLQNSYDEAKEREPFAKAMVELGRCNHVNAVLSDDDFYHFKSDWEVWKACAKSRARSAE